MSIEIGVILPTSTPDPARPILGDVRESARFADEAGLDSVWSTDKVNALLLDFLGQRGESAVSRSMVTSENS